MFKIKFKKKERIRNLPKINLNSKVILCKYKTKDEDDDIDKYIENYDNVNAENNNINNANIVINNQNQINSTDNNIDNNIDNFIQDFEDFDNDYD